MFNRDMQIAGFDDALWDAMQQEVARQEAHIELIASENYASPRVMQAQGTQLTNKYAEGYPGKRYYGGCEHVDVVEQMAIDYAKELFDATYANVQPHSGSQANGAVFQALVKPGDTVAKISREVYKTRDITGGLPRVAELFEARRPKDPAVITEIDGEISFGDIKRGKREVHVTPGTGELRTYPVPVGKHMRVHEGDRVRAGDRLSEGPINPHDILRIKGPRAVQEYLLNEIQEVYRLQGVKINDKHIGVIVRQMLQKVEVSNGGDTTYLVGELVDRVEFDAVNAKTKEEGGKQAQFLPVLQGITKASLQTRSFISAASFQETTRVLTEAAVSGRVDNLIGLKENVIVGRPIPAGTGSIMNGFREIAAERDKVLSALQTEEQADFEIENAESVVEEAPAEGAK